MLNSLPRPLALIAVCAALGASPLAHAQGFEVLPWSAPQMNPAWQGVDLSGRQWRLSELRGKAVLLNFWASWCAPCLAEMPSLQALAERHGPERLLVLTLNFKESAAVVQRFAQRSDLRLPLLLDPQGQWTRQWGVSTFPSTVLIGADGQIQALVRGELDWTGTAARALIAPLLAQQPPSPPVKP